MARNPTRESGNSKDSSPLRQDSAFGKTLTLPSRQEFLDWLAVTPRTRQDYARYYDKLAAIYPQGIPYQDIPDLAMNKWQRNLIRKIAQYQWARGVIAWEDRARVEALAKPPKGAQTRRVQSIIYSIEDFKATLDFIRDQRYRLLYIIMYYSGARISETLELLRVANQLDEIKPERAKKVRGYTTIGNSVRIAMHYNRGRKRCEYLWLPKWLLELVMAKAEKGLEATSTGIRSYYRDLKNKLGDKVKLIPPGDVRALHFQLMEDLEIDPMIRYIIQNRYSRLTVSELHYSKILRRADEAYEQRILPFLEEKLRG